MLASTNLQKSFQNRTYPFINAGHRTRHHFEILRFHGYWWHFTEFLSSHTRTLFCLCIIHKQGIQLHYTSLNYNKSISCHVSIISAMQDYLYLSDDVNTNTIFNAAFSRNKLRLEALSQGTNTCKDNSLSRREETEHQNDKMDVLFLRCLIFFGMVEFNKYWMFWFKANNNLFYLFVQFACFMTYKMTMYPDFWCYCISRYIYKYFRFLSRK